MGCFELYDACSRGCCAAAKAFIRGSCSDTLGVFKWDTSIKMGHLD
jgi:hypothetical protein